MIFLKKISAIAVIISTFLFILFMFTINVRGITITLIIMFINIIINEVCKTIMKTKIMNNEYRKRFNNK